MAMQLDPSTNPADNFFGYVNNDWIKNNPIPPDESSWSSFNVLRVNVEHQLKNIFDDLAAADETALNPTARKVRDFYQSGMDVSRLNTMKDAPLEKLIQEIDAVQNVEDLARILGNLHRHGVNAWWTLVVEPDAKHSDVDALYIYQAGLGLPDRDYYLDASEKSALIRKQYVDYARDLAVGSAVIGGEVAARSVPGMIDLEAELARASMTRVELRDVEKQYNKMTFADIAKVAPRISWERYFEGLGAPMPEYAIVCQPDFLAAVNRQFEGVPLTDLKSYLRWHVLNGMANFLGEQFEQKVFDFYGRIFGGATEMKSRWRRVLGVVNGMLDEAVGELYVARHFGEEARAKVSALVDHLMSAYRTRIMHLDWMGDETKEKALAKLAAIEKKLGYPDHWKDIATLEIGADSYVENYMRAYAFDVDRLMKKVGKPVDRSEWHMPPQMVNAYYNPLANEIVFPAAILQPPFFDSAANDAVNFGGIGTVIGHELTHGFDDKGSLFDLHGNLAQWWMPEDKERFDVQTNHLAEQYDTFEPLPGLHVNGKLTLGENIADLGGLLIAFDGLTLSLREKPVPAVDGLSPYQQFFVNYAVTERGAVREEALRLKVQTDPHSPSRYRVNGPLSNMTEFYEAFHCAPGNALWRDPDDRVRIW